MGLFELCNEASCRRCNNSCSSSCSSSCSPACSSNCSSNCSSACSSTCEECIIAYKIYDQCRQQICLTPTILGPARASKCTTACDTIYHEGDTIVPPSNAASVSIECFKLSRIIIVSKCPNSFRTGYWDVDLRYVFSYNLVFKTSEGCEICCVPANSVYTTTVTLFGSVGSEIVTVSDLYCSEATSANSGPYVTVEGKAVPLAAELVYTTKTCCEPSSSNSNCSCLPCAIDNCGCIGGFSGCCITKKVATSVGVTIGLFTIIKMFRLVNILVSSSGICVPEECESTASAANPCDFFNSLDFPMDVFSPPGTPEDLSGCGCSNECNSCSNCGCS
ncbi:MAG: hypothetical protein VB120_08450 [Lachnospiraceae bacterium]|nr:hypothetical protein [Lachnospiraceae bacterium]